MQINLFLYLSMSMKTLELRENSMKTIWYTYKIDYISAINFPGLRNMVRYNAITQWFNMQIINLKYLCLLIKK